MKKKLLLLLALPLLTGCSGSYTYTPKFAYPGEDPVVKEENLVVTFYLDYNHSDETLYKPVHTMKWYLLEPLHECPKEAVLTDKDAPDPLYPVFLGYSEYPTCIDEEKIWNFETDYKQQNPLKLYGIWVAKQEDEL